MKIGNSTGFRRPEKVATTSQRLKYIIDEKNIKQAELSRATGISRGAISNYVLGRYAPKSEIMQKLADALNCSVYWLRGYDVPMEIRDYSFAECDSFCYYEEENPYELEIRDLLDELSLDVQESLLEAIKDLAKNPNKQISLSHNTQLTAKEKQLLSLFRQIPANKQDDALELFKTVIKMQQGLV